MPAVPITANDFPKTIYGVHDLEGANFLAQNNCAGWLLHTVKVDADAPTDYTPYLNQGLRVLVRLNHDYGDTGNGTIPLPAQYDAFAQRCADWVAASKGARNWLIGNEMNHPSEWPGGQQITPAQYASCFTKCRNAIHAQPGHANDQVIPGATAPWNPAMGDWVKYCQDLLTRLKGNCDGIALHTYTHGTSADLITDESKFGYPYQNNHCHFRTYRDFMSVIPAEMRGLPVYITETQTVLSSGPAWTHQNTGWVQAAYSEINAWNKNAQNQPLQALILFRWKADGNPQWALANFQEIQADFRAALAQDHRLVLPRAVQAPSLQQTVLATAQAAPWMPVNNTAALWKFAQAQGLQDQQTDELTLTFQGAEYILQVFNLGIVYCKKGDYGNITIIRK